MFPRLALSVVLATVAAFVLVLMSAAVVINHFENEKVFSEGGRIGREIGHGHGKEGVFVSYFRRALESTRFSEDDDTLTTTTTTSDVMTPSPKEGVFTFTYNPAPMGKHSVNYTFTAASEYQGPIVEGWPPNSNRNLPDYIRPTENTILTDTTCMSLSSAKVLIIVQSAPELSERRMVNRLTWMAEADKHYPNGEVKVIFVFGTTNDQTAMDNVQSEVKQYCDVIQMDYIDTYTNVTMDTVSALKVALGYRWSGNKTPDFLMIADDDSYVNVKALMKTLYHDKVMTKTDPYLLGKLFVKHPVRKPTDPNATLVEHCKTPSYMYDGDIYPNFVCGGGYILPWSTLDCLYVESLTLPYFHINDIHVTGFAAEKCGYKRKDHKGIYSRKIHPRDLKPNDIVIHQINSKQKAIMHHIITVQNGILQPWMPNAYHLENGELLYCGGDATICFWVSFE